MTLAVAIAALALAAVWFLRTVRKLAPPQRFLASARPRSARTAPAPPPDLARVERVVASGIGSSSDLHTQLRPLLREAAAERLRRRGLSLDSGSEAVRECLGEEAWDLLRPDRERPERPFGGGMRRERLEAIVERLEAL